jgi:transketolase
MRKQFCEAMVHRSSQENLVFLTGDLGFMALEPLQEVLGKRFINAGVAEQNMISVAAGMAKTGLEPWVYSIAPFCYARPFEQIRNDIALHNLPVKLVGNGGGYGYGVMGPTHHAIEDYGILLSLPYMQVCAPVFDEDLAAAVVTVGSTPSPFYLRLGRGEPPKDYSIPAFAPWRQLVKGAGPVVLAVGPLASTYIQACLDIPEKFRPNLWAISLLPLDHYSPPEAFLKQIQNNNQLIVAEEHVSRGGLGSELALWLGTRGLLPSQFIHLHAQAHRFEKYGSQSYLRKQSQIDPESLLTCLASLK